MSKHPEPSPFTKGPEPTQDGTPLDRTYATLPIKAVIKTFTEVEFAAAARANPNGDYAVVPKSKCCGDGTGA